MFGISIFELIILLILALLFIRPKDLPEIAYFCGRFFYKIKKIYYDVKDFFKNGLNDFGLDDIKYEIQRGIAEEKSNDDDTTIIVDMYGKEHRVNLNNVNRQISEDEKQDIKKQNSKLAKNKS